MNFRYCIISPLLVRINLSESRAQMLWAWKSIVWVMYNFEIFLSSRESDGFLNRIHLRVGNWFVSCLQHSDHIQFPNFFYDFLIV
jgi:hypothetical protein